MANEVQNQQLSQLAGISGILGKTHCGNAISKFTGETKKFRNWVKSIEEHVKIMAKHEDEAVGIAYQASEGLVSDFIGRYTTAHSPTLWADLKKRANGIFWGSDGSATSFVNVATDNSKTYRRSTSICRAHACTRGRRVA